MVILVNLIVGIFFINDSKANSYFIGFGNIAKLTDQNHTDKVNPLEVKIDKIISMKSDNNKKMNLKISLEMKNRKDKNIFKVNAKSIKETILKFSSSQDSDVLSTLKGKTHYKDDLKELIYESYALEVKSIHIIELALVEK